MRTIGYVLKRFPRLSETFILQEIRGLERLGVRLHIFAIMDPREAIVHSDVQSVTAQVHYLHISPLVDAAHMISSHARLLFRAPLRYLGVLKHILDTRQPTWRGLYLALKHFMEAGYLAELARRYEIDHLHAHFANNPTSLARFAQLLTGIPFSFTAHAKDIYTADAARLADKILYSEFTVTCTAYNMEYLNSLVGPTGGSTVMPKVHLVYHGVDALRFRPLEVSRTGTRSDSGTARRPRILSVGRLVTKKGHTDLIQACQQLKQKGHFFDCEIYGSGPLRSELENLIKQLDVEDRVSLKGARTQQELIAIYQAADIFVLAPFILQNGDRDGLPNVLLEAMACGLPVVATRISGIPELITNGESGLLVEPHDAAGLAAALERLLTDLALRARLGMTARRHVEQDFSAQVNTQSLAALFGFETKVAMTGFPAKVGATASWRPTAEVQR